MASAGGARRDVAEVGAVRGLLPNTNAHAGEGVGVWFRRKGEPDDYLLSHGSPHYHWRGVVSRSCSGWEGVVPTRYGHQAKGGAPGPVRRRGAGRQWGRRSNGVVAVSCAGVFRPGHDQRAQLMTGALKRTGYRIKPHGQLVSVSLTHYCAYTPDLSTFWS